MEYTPKDYTPKQSAPVNRREVIQPYTTVDVLHGPDVESLVQIRMALLHGANYNNPAAWRVPSYNSLKTSGGS